MGEFIFNRGRSKTAHSYPENTRAAVLEAFARNFGTGPDTDTPITTDPGVAVPWSFSGTSVPITPKSTGYLRITAMLSVESTGGADIQALVTVDGVALTVPTTVKQTIDADGFNVISVLAETAPTPPPGGVATPVGASYDIGIQLIKTTVDPTDATLVGTSSLIDIQEVSAPTG